MWTNHNIDVNSIKWQSIKAYTYDYIQVSEILMSRFATLTIQFRCQNNTWHIFMVFNNFLSYTIFYKQNIILVL